MVESEPKHVVLIYKCSSRIKNCCVSDGHTNKYYLIQHNGMGNIKKKKSLLVAQIYCRGVSS